MSKNGPSDLTDEQKAEAERLRALLETAPTGIQARVAEETGSSPSAVNQQVRGWRPLNAKTAAAFARQLGIPVARISERLADELAQLTSLQVSMRSRSRMTADLTTGAGIRDVVSGYNTTPAEVGRRRIPLISHVQAGGWGEAADPYAVGHAEAWLVTDLDLSPGAFALRVKGDSMLPEFKEGDVVIIDPAVQPMPGDLVVAKNSGEEAMFKKYRPRGADDQGRTVFELVPLNPDYPTKYSDKEPITIIGTMVEHRRFRRR